MDAGDFRAQAIAQGAGTHIVYNITNNTVQQYYIGRSTGGGGGPVVPLSANSAAARRAAAVTAATQTVQRQTPLPAVAEEVRLGHRMYVEGGLSIRPTYVVPVSQLGLNANAASKTAYDYVGDYNLQAMVESATGNVNTITRVVGANALTALSDLVGHFSNYTGLRDQARLMFRVVFVDGSYVTVIVDLQHQNGQTESKSARTAAGQLIPSDIQELNGEWTNEGGGENLTRMGEHMAALGATVKTTGPTSGGYIKGISCSGSGTAKVCYVQYMAK
ncbi:hypothetical protein [Xanthomonas sp. 60]